MYNMQNYYYSYYINQKEKKVDIEKVKVLLNDITKNLKNITNKIDAFLVNI